MAVLGIASTAALVLGALLFVRWALGARLSLRWPVVAGLCIAGGLAAIGCSLLQRWLWNWTGLDPYRGLEGGTGALIAMMVLAVPLEEASKLLSVWPVYMRGRLRGHPDGIVAAVATAAGFAVAETTSYALAGTSGALFVVRSLLGGLAHILFAGAWGFVLSDAAGGRYLRRTWLSAVLFHGLFDHIVYGRGPGTLVVAAPLLFGMLGLSWVGLREARAPREARKESEPALTQALAEPTFDLIRAVRRRERPLSLFWIVAGAFITTGVALCAAALAVLLGHQLGMDFAATDEREVGGNAPLLLLGSGTLSAFGLAGYLIAKASGTESVLEPALGAAASIAMVLLLLSLATPVAIVFSLAVAPVAFGLSCIGAWFGMER